MLSRSISAGTSYARAATVDRQNAPLRQHRCVCHVQRAPLVGPSTIGAPRTDSLCGSGQRDKGIAAATLLQRSWAAGLLRRSDTGAAAALLALAGCAWLAQAGSVSAADLAHSHPSFHPVADLAQGEDFWSNVGRYGSYFFSVLLGTAYTAVRPIGGLLRKPVTAVATLAALAALAIFVTTTVSAMLGLNGGYEYEASSLLPPPRS